MSGRWTGGEVIARGLAARGVDTVFTVSGNQILPIFDAAHDARLRMIHMRHESAAVYSAIGAAELHGGASVALVSAGPGFLASLQGVGVARSMELPVLLLAGAAPIAQRQSGAFQDIDQRAIAAPLCKGTFEPDSVESLGAELIAAWQLATSGVPGPVLISLPADVLAAETELDEPLGSPADTQSHPGESEREVLAAMAQCLADARRPALVVRPSASRSPHLQRLSQLLGVTPIITESPRGLSDSRYGDLSARLRDSDCVLVIAGADFGTGFLNPAIVGSLDRILLIDDAVDPEPRGPLRWRCRVAPDRALSYLADNIQGTAVDPDWSEALSITSPPSLPHVDPPEGLHPLAVAATIRSMLHSDDVIVLDGGEFCQWMRLGLRDVHHHMLWNGKLGAIGGSIPMALGAAATAPGRRVIALLGDGSAGYFLSEFESLTRYGMKITAIIGNDARWAAEWHMQVARYGPDRTFDTDLSPARYDLAAAAYGGQGINVANRAELLQGLTAALESPLAACVNVRVAAERSPAEVLH